MSKFCSEAAALSPSRASEPSTELGKNKHANWSGVHVLKKKLGKKFWCVPIVENHHPGVLLTESSSMFQSYHPHPPPGWEWVSGTYFRHVSLLRDLLRGSKCLCLVPQRAASLSKWSGVWWFIKMLWRRMLLLMPASPRASVANRERAFIWGNGLLMVEFQELRKSVENIFGKRDPLLVPSDTYHLSTPILLTKQQQQNHLSLFWKILQTSAAVWEQEEKRPPFPSLPVGNQPQPCRFL